MSTSIWAGIVPTRHLGGNRAGRRQNSRPDRRVVIAAAAALTLLVACSGDDDGGAEPPASDLATADPGDCIVVDMAVSSEKIALLTELADDFNGSDEAVVGERCVFVRPRSVASGNAANLIVDGWPNPEANGEPPVIWSPAASGWAAIVNERAGEILAPAGTPFMLTPLVIAMPRPMAEALGWPDESIGFADLAELAENPEGWAAAGHPEWGPFRLGKTNPNYSTSGLNFTVAEYYAATGKTADLTTEDLARPAAVDFATQIESAVVHYGDITMTFLNNWFAADVRGTALTYASAVAVEEKSVIDYNLGNPDGVLSPGEEPRCPAIRSSRSTPRRGRSSPTTRSSCSTPRGSTRTRRRRRRCSRSTSSARRTSKRCSSSGSDPTIRRSRWRSRSSPRTVSIPSSRRLSLRCRRPTCSSGSSTHGPSCARTHGCCSCSTSRARWATRGATAGPSSTSPSRRP